MDDDDDDIWKHLHSKLIGDKDGLDIGSHEHGGGMYPPMPVGYASPCDGIHQPSPAPDPFSDSPKQSTDTFGKINVTSCARKEYIDDEPLCPNRMFHIQLLMIAILLVGHYIANIHICIAIGRTSAHWTNVFSWTLLGMFPLLLIFYYCAYLFLSKPFHAIFQCYFCICVILVNCFGAPLAELAAQRASIDAYLNPAMAKSINCWRNPSDPILMHKMHFLRLEEANWKVDYRTRANQKVATLTGDGGNMYNFCIAPIVYTGTVPCNYQFLAACFRQSVGSAIASCDDNDARTCGWNYPANAVTLRVINRNEQLFTDIDLDSEIQWKAAGAMTENTVSPRVLVLYGGAGQAEFEELEDAVNKKFSDVFIAAMVVGAGILVAMGVVASMCSCKRYYY